MTKYYLNIVSPARRPGYVSKNTRRPSIFRFRRSIKRLWKRITGKP